MNFLVKLFLLSKQNHQLWILMITHTHCLSF